MRNRVSTKLLAIMLCLVLVLSAFPLTAGAYDYNYQSETHTVFRHTEQTLAPGVEYYNNYAYLNDGEQVVYYVAVADINRDDVLVQGSYWNMQTEQYGMSKLTEQVASANAKFTDPNDPDFISENYTVVAGTNGDFYNMQTGQPSGAFAINGHIMNNANNRPWFAVFEDGTALCGANNTDYNAAIASHGAVMNSVGGSQLLVNNGVDVTASASGSYNTDRHSRTMIGVTADNKVVCAVVDGRQSPFSDGGSMHELAQIMLEAECVQAINLDGGGSTTFGSRPEGEDSFRVINRPSDGSERSISSGVIIASLAAPSDVFDRAAITVEDEYVTPYAEVNFSVVGVSSSGASAELPDDITYSATLGQVIDGKFISDGTVGDAEIRAMYNGEVVGAATVHVVIPDTVTFYSESITVPFGESAELTIHAKYGLNAVTVKPTDFTYTLADPNAGSISDGVITAPDAESGITGTTVTAVLVYDPSVSATANILYGKGSETIFDFEDGTTQGFNLNYSNYNYYLPRSSVYVADAETGKVHSGNYSLALNIDYSNSQESGYQMIALYQGKVSGGAAYYEDALTLGTWLYIPDEYVGLWVRWTISPIASVEEDAEGNKTYTLTSLNSNAMDGGAGGTGVVYSFDESGWHYLTADLSPYKGLAWRDYYYCMQFYISDRDGTAYGYYAKNNHNINGNFTVYMDDVTVDYSTVINDREAPVFSSVLLGDRGPHSNEAMTLTDGFVSDGYSQLTFSARVADKALSNATGINADSAKAYIDGNEVPCTFANGLMSIDEYDFAEGQHTVKFVICDNAGNRSSATRSFQVTNVAKSEAVKVVAHDPSLVNILHGSLYYVDVVAENIEDIASVEAALNLDSMSKWELDHMEVADGFEVSYVLDEPDQILHLSIERTGAVALNGENALVSIPIRSWELDNMSKLAPLSSKNWNYAEFKASKEFWPVAVEVRIQQGSVEFVNGSVDFFTGENVFCWTESWANYANMNNADSAYLAAWNGGHDHRPEYADYYASGTTNYSAPIVSKEAQAPGCVEPGWTEELFCPVCNSVVKWSEEIPAAGHNFEMVPAKTLKFIISDNGANQSADLVFEGGVGYYYDNGEYKTFDTDPDSNVVTFTNSGNFTTPTIYYWFDGEEAPNAWPGVPMEYFGQNEYDQAQFTFEMPEIPEHMACTECGELCNETVDGVRYVDGLPAQGFVDGRYYVDGVDQNYDGFVLIDGYYYEFVEGVSQGKYTGPITIDGEYYYSKLGELTGGWFEIDEEWYYFDEETLKPVPEKTFTYPNSQAVTTYQFEENGKLVDGVWVTLSGGTRYYYGPTFYKLNAARGNALWAEIHGNMYAFDGMGYRHEGISWIIESNNPRELYEFTDEGVLVGKYTGIYEGKYYTEGKQGGYNGILKIDNDYYYVKANGDLFVGTISVSEALTHGYVPAGSYEFGEDYKMVQKSGIVDGYYYVDGVLCKGAGVVEVDGDYYYITNTGKYYVGSISIGEAKTNGLVPAGPYTFGEDGKMILKNGIVDGYYYIDNVLQKGVGVIEYEDDLYYITATGKYYVGSISIGAAKTNGLCDPGTYEFGEDGKMIRANGIVNGYYYENGVIVKGAGVIEFEGDLYYIKADGKYYVGRISIGAAKTNGLCAPGSYEFGQDGKMIRN